MKLWTLVILALLEPAVIVGCGGEAGDPSEEPESVTEAEPVAAPERETWCCELRTAQGFLVDHLCLQDSFERPHVSDDYRCWEVP